MTSPAMAADPRRHGRPSRLEPGRVICANSRNEKDRSYYQVVYDIGRFVCGRAPHRPHTPTRYNSVVYCRSIEVDKLCGSPDSKAKYEL